MNSNPSVKIDKRPWIGVQEVSAYTGIPVATFYAWRHRGTGGPKCARIGRHLRYRWSDLETWFDAQAVNSGEAA